MSQFSSISFSDPESTPSPRKLNQTNNQLDMLLLRLGTTLQQVKELNGESTEIYRTMSELVRQTQSKLDESKKQSIQIHRRCLQNIEILLFQQDYAQALAKIDLYKKSQLTDLSFQEYITQKLPAAMDPQQYTFQQAKTIINSQFADLQLKELVWLQYALEEEENGEELTHATYEDVQSSLLQHFKKQFDILSEMTEEADNNVGNLATPEKKNYKSVSFLKSSAKQHKSGNFAKGRENEKSAGKIGGSAKKRSSQKRTTRKKGIKEPQESRTSKKLTPFIA